MRACLPPKDAAACKRRKHGSLSCRLHQSSAALAEVYACFRFLIIIIVLEHSKQKYMYTIGFLPGFDKFLEMVNR